MPDQDTPLAARTILPGVPFQPADGTTPEGGGIPGQRDTDLLQGFAGWSQGQPGQPDQEAGWGASSVQPGWEQQQGYAQQEHAQQEHGQQGYAQQQQQYQQPQYQQPQYQQQPPPQEFEQQQYQPQQPQQYQQPQQFEQQQPPPQQFDQQQYQPQQYQQAPPQYQQPYEQQEQPPIWAASAPSAGGWQQTGPPNFAPAAGPPTWVLGQQAPAYQIPGVPAAAYGAPTFASPPPPAPAALWGELPPNAGFSDAPVEAGNGRRRLGGRGRRRKQGATEADSGPAPYLPQMQPDHAPQPEQAGAHRRAEPAHATSAGKRSPRTALVAGGAIVLLAAGGFFGWTQLNSSTSPAVSPAAGAGAGTLRFSSPANVAGLAAQSPAAAAATGKSVTASLARRAPGTPAPAKVLAFGSGSGSSIDVAVYRHAPRSASTAAGLVKGLSRPLAGDRAVAARATPAGAAGGQMTCGAESGKAAGSWCVWTGTSTTGVTQAPGSTDISALAAQTRELRAYAEH